MKEIKAIIQPFMLEKVLHALAAIEDLPGVTISDVMGWGKSRAADAGQVVQHAGHSLAKKSKLEVVVGDDLAHRVEEAIALAAHTGRPGDGKIFVYDVQRVLKIRTGETGQPAV
ncbi:MAG: P-II family nitrogen regulator [Thermoanaerobaculia bacterium]|nr:P-II family nitrogen regulator [Thermoanaerobaculia bacterium]